MRNDELTQSVVNAEKQAVVFAFNGMIRTASQLTKQAIKAMDAHGKKTVAERAADEYGRSDKRGLQDIKDLSTKNTAKSMLEAEGKLEGFDNYANQFYIDYSVMYDQNSDKTLLIFQSKDTDTMNKAFQSYLSDSIHQDIGRTSIYEKVADIQARQAGETATAAKDLGRGGAEATKGTGTAAHGVAQTAEGAASAGTGVVAETAAKVAAEAAKQIQKAATSSIEKSR